MRMMANYLDIPRDEADEILAKKKSAPVRDFTPLRAGSHETWEMVVGVMVVGGLYKKSLTVELLCHQSLKPERQTFKFCLFYHTYGRRQRAYQLDTTSAPICNEGAHDWPHQHIGQDRIDFTAQYPVNFAQSIAYFCNATNIKFDDHIDSPFDFKLKLS